MQNAIKKVLYRGSWLATLCFLTTLFFAPSLYAEEESAWPREIITTHGILTIYLPQVESFEADTLSSRAAVSVKLTGEDEPIFGTIWIVANVDVDREKRLAYPKNVRVPRVHFSNSTPAKEANLASTIEEAAKSWDLTLSIDRIIPMLEVAQKEQHTSQNLSNDPPIIIYKESPSVLVSIDGEPKLIQVKDTKFKQIINTSFFILLDETQPLYYLYASENGWYTTKGIKEEWQYVTSVPEDVSKLAPKADEIDAPEESDEIEGAIPIIVVATEPTELLFTEGKPVYEDLPGTAMSYATNTANVIILHGKQQVYILLSGRWFTSKSLEGGWKYIAADKLPEDFSKIPADSAIGGALYAVAGTDQANEAVLDAYVPQTAKVDRKNVTLKVEYDGEPKFDDIPGTGLKYAVNSDQQVLFAGQHYFACVDAVWYVADTPKGPWSVATERPDGIDQIPPESPVYNVKYVYIYDVQPDVVYVGYLPGYTGTYIYHSTIVYGTGYYYYPWYHHYYYPRRGTWGVGVRYSPWGGWSFGIGYSTGRFTFGRGFGGHRYGYRGGYHRGYHRGYNRGYSHGARAGYSAGSRNAYRSSNVYRNQNRSGIHAPERRAHQGVQNTARQNTKNNMYSDRKGDVYKRGDHGNWQQQGNKAANKPTQKPSTTARPNRTNQRQQDSLNRQHSARDRGTQRTQQYRSSSHSRPARSGGGSRGGGRRR